jgi:histidine triad (HIT) family protein
MQHDPVENAPPPPVGAPVPDGAPVPPHLNERCVFCRIILRREPARIVYEDDDVIVIHNVLGWVPVMLLSLPKQHLMQYELWTSPLMAKVSKAAAEQGEQHCPRGFRLLSNFGPDGMQSQPHAHVHVIGGTFLGEYA